MVTKIISILIRKHGMKNVRLMIGDIAVKATKSKEDDKIWAQVKKVLDKF